MTKSVVHQGKPKLSPGRKKLSHSSYTEIRHPNSKRVTNGSTK